MNEPKQIDLINPNDQASLEMSLLISLNLNT